MLRPRLDPAREIPLYRQLGDYLRGAILAGQIAAGGRLPTMRELSEALGLHRSTVAAAYELLEHEGLVRTQVGKGSFVVKSFAGGGGRLDWDQLLGPLVGETPPAGPSPRDVISFASSRPAEDLFPMEELRATVDEVIRGRDVTSILQIGPPAGYPPLRLYLIEEARAQGLLREDEDLLITSGCQQALDLLERVLIRGGEHSVALEDPVYPGVRNLFLRSGARVLGVPVGEQGVEVEALARALSAARPRLLVLTPNFQNPTGTTIPIEARRAILKQVRKIGTVLVENDIYGALRYRGTPVKPFQQLDASGHVVRLRSFSKMAFPGLRVGWVSGPAPLIARMAEAKQLADLHSDQLSQAVLLRFVESGRLDEHLQRMLRAGRERLEAVEQAVAKYLPQGTAVTRTDGGMNLWVRLPEPLDAAGILPKAQRRGVSYLPGKYFWVDRREPGALRLSFAGLTVDEIERGVRILGEVCREEMRQPRADRVQLEPAVV